MYRYFIKPKSTDEDISRREFILNVILSGSILLFTLLNILILYNTLRLQSNYRGVPLSVFFVLFFYFLWLLWLSRNGRHILASYLLIATYFIATTYAIYRWGPDLPTALLGYTLVITISSIVISTRFAFFITSVISFSLIVFTYLQSELIFLPSLDWKTENLGVYDGIGFAGLLFVIMVISWLSNREIERSLRRARSSETALRNERDSLEIKVSERTEELHRLQLQRVSELHHLAGSGKLAAGFFHELMNPLTALTLAIENLGAKTKPSQELSQQVNKALQASRRVGQFITAIQRQTTVTAEPQLLDLGAELEYTVKLLDYKARKNHLTLQLQAAKEVQLLISPVEFHRIVHNLIDFPIEAAKSWPANTTPAISINLSQQTGTITLAITYPGLTLPEQNITTNELGLAIAKDTLLQRGGLLRIEQDSSHQNIILRAEFPH